MLEKQIKEIAEVLEADESKVFPEQELKNIPEWDSFGMIKVIAFMDREYNKMVKMEDIESLRTVADLLGMME